MFKNIRKVTISIVVLGVVCGLFFMNYKNNPFIQFSGFAQGTTYSIKYVKPFNFKTIFDLSDSQSRRVQKSVDELLLEFDLSLSGYNDSSIISKINRNQNVDIDSLFVKVFNRSKDIYDETNGLLDISAGPLFNIWGFGFKSGEMPSQFAIDSVKQFIGMDKVSLIGNKIIKQNPNLTLNVNAIAQGYSVDVVAGYLQSIGITDFIVEIGGEIFTKGVKPSGENWVVGIDKPIDNNNTPGENLQIRLKLCNQGLATSGNYRKFYVKEGKKYAHTVNPIEGYPVQHSLLSATVIAKNAMDADGYATVLMVLGEEKAVEFLKNKPELQAYLIYFEDEQYKVFMTPDFDKMIVE